MQAMEESREDREIVQRLATRGSSDPLGARGKWVLPEPRRGGGLH